jgi:nucleoside-diphosphate-sugar epimerase
VENEKRELARAVTGERRVVVMSGLVCGRSDGLLRSFVVEPGRAARSMPCIGDGSHHWAPVHVDDIAELYVLALKTSAGSVYAGVSGPAGRTSRRRTSPEPSATLPDARDGSTP